MFIQINYVLDEWQNSIQWSNGITSSQSMGFNDVKPWSADFSNPFKVNILFFTKNINDY